MQWPEWVEKVLDTIAHKWDQTPNASQQGIQLSAEVLFPGEGGDLDAALATVYYDLIGLDLIADPFGEFGPVSVVLTDLGHYAAQQGLAQTLAPRISATYAGLTPRARQFLVNLVQSVTTADQPTEYALQLTCNAPDVYREITGHWDMNADRNDLRSIVSSLANTRCIGAVVHNGQWLIEDQVWPLYVGFQCVRQGESEAK